MKLRQHVSDANVSQIAISAIVVGVRRRTKLGRLASLAKSIERYGLIHPILVRNGNELVAGQRRLEACRQLGWTKIPARCVDELSDEELRAIESDENRERQAFNTYEDSKQRVAEIRQAEADLKADSRLHSKRESPKRGGQRKPGSKRDVAGVTGRSPASQLKDEKHVEIADRFPFMQRPGWVQHAVLEAGTFLDQLPERDASAVAALLDQDAIPPKKAIRILENVVTLPAVERQDIFRLARSTDNHERQIALTKAAAVPPPVDPGLLILGEAETQLRKAARVCRTAEFRSQLADLAEAATQLHNTFSEANRNARRTVPESTPAFDSAAGPS